MVASDMHIHLLLWLSSLAPALATGGAEEAEIEFQLGLDAYTKGDYNLALSRFLSSNRLAPNPAVAFNIARCYAKSERYAESYRWYTLAAQNLSDPDGLRAVQEGISAVVPKVVVYDIVTEPVGVDVYVDSKDYGVVGTTPLKLALAPSESRTLVFSREGYEDVVLFNVRGERGQTVPATATLKQIVGTVAVSGSDGAELRLGTPMGPLLCTLPCETALPPGNRVLYVRREGFRDSALQLEIEANQRIETTVVLSPNTGSILVQSSERGSLVEIDGVAAGFTPAVVRAVAVGERVVRVSLPGFAPIERVVQVETDQQIELTDIALTPSDAITAVSRRAEQASSAPSSITLITRAEIEAFRYPTLYEALRGVRGFALTQDSIYGNAAVRGLGQQNDFGNKLLMLSDGAVVNDNMLAASYLLYDGMVDTDVIEQIEVVRGPGSLLYGAGAVSGVVNMVGAPRSAPDGVTVRGGAYDRTFFGTGRVKKDISEAFGFRAEVSAAASQGREETIDPRGESPPLEVDGVERFEATTTSGRIWLGKDATAQWFHTWRKQHIPTGVFGTKFGDTNDNFWTDQRSLAEIRYEPTLSSATALFSRVFASRYQYDASYPYLGSTSIERYLGVASGGELRLITEPSTLLRLQVGAQGTVSPIMDLHGEDVASDGTTTSYLDEAEPFWTTSAYAVVDLVPAELIALSLGARIDYWSTFGLAPSPRATVVVTPTDTDVIKIIAGRAFRAPSIYELYYNSPGIQARSDADGSVLRPEAVWSAEIEYSHRFGPLWTALASGHGSFVSELIETVPFDEDGVVVYRNSDLPIQILGTDVELRRSFQGGLLASAFYSYLESRYTDGVVVPNAPRHNAGFKAVFPIAPPEVRLAVRSSLEGTRRIDFSREDETKLALITDVVLSGEVPNLLFDYAFGVYNVLDMRYEQPLTDTFPMRTIGQPGRSLMFNVTKSF